MYVVDITVSITASSTNTAGETYSLVCSATVTGSTDQPTITWLDPMNNPVPSEMVTTTGSVSTLTFNPLAASHAGTYKCSATVEGAMPTATVVTLSVRSKCSLITSVIAPIYFDCCFPNPAITVSIVASVTTQEVGLPYTLNCTVTGAERLTDSNITYQWLKDGVALIVSGQAMETLSFTSLSVSDAGGYTCQATVVSSLLRGPIDTPQSSVFSINPTGESKFVTYHACHIQCSI